MKMPNRKIEKVVSKGDCRYYLENPYLDTEASVIVSTNGQVMAVCPVELDEEDIALCSYICLSKTNFGYLLRRGLNFIEKEG